MRSAVHALFVVAVVAIGVGLVSPWAWLLQYSLAIPSVPLAVDQWLSAAQHFLAYVVLTVAGLLGFSGPRAWFWVGGSLFVYGMGLEVAQVFVADRSGSLLDVIANGVGIGLGIWVKRMAAIRRAASN